MPAMTIPRTLAIAALVVALAAVGCGKRDDAPKDKAGKGAEPAKAPVATQPAEDMQPEPDAFDAEAFCAAVFGADAVVPMVGVDGLAYTANRGRLPSGMAQCNLEKSDPDTKIPIASATAMFDCRGISLNVDKHREVHKQLGKDSYHDVDIGKGGAYAKTVAAKITIHQVTFVHESAPCSVTVSTAQIDDDHSEALATHVNGKLTADNAPRR